MLNYNFNRLWNTIKRSVFGRMVQREVDLPLAMDLLRSLYLGPNAQLALGRTFLKMPVLKGAYGEESLRFLVPVNQAAVDLTGANAAVFNVFDFTLVKTIGLVWTVAGTVTAMVMDFDLHDRLAAGNLLTDKLDGTNGVITSPAVADQAIGDVLYKDLDATGPVLIQPGYSINAVVTTTVTAGNGNPFVLGYHKPETFANLAAARKVLSA